MLWLFSLFIFRQKSCYEAHNIKKENQKSNKKLLLFACLTKFAACLIAKIIITNPKEVNLSRLLQLDNFLNTNKNSTKLIYIPDKE